MKRGVGKVRLLDGKLLWGYGFWIQNRKDFNMVQVPTDSNMEDKDINTRPLGG